MQCSCTCHIPSITLIGIILNNVLFSMKWVLLIIWHQAICCCFQVKYEANIINLSSLFTFFFSQFYEDWALIRDQQRFLLLANMASGMAFIFLDYRFYGDKLNQAWSILPALELLPLDCSRCSWAGATPIQAKRIKLDLGISYIVVFIRLSVTYFDNIGYCALYVNQVVWFIDK